MSKIKNSFLKDVVRRAECIPLRLTSAERELLTILQGALDVSEYTENVDVSQNDFFARSRYDKHVTILAQIDELLATLIGLNATSGDKKSNSMLVCSTRDNAPFFRSCLEVGRRYKIMNPDKMRTIVLILSGFIILYRRPTSKHDRKNGALSRVEHTNMLLDFLSPDVAFNPISVANNSSI